MPASGGLILAGSSFTRRKVVSLMKGCAMAASAVGPDVSWAATHTKLTAKTAVQQNNVILRAYSCWQNVTFMASSAGFTQMRTIRSNWQSQRHSTHRFDSSGKTIDSCSTQIIASSPLQTARRAGTAGPATDDL